MTFKKSVLSLAIIAATTGTAYGQDSTTNTTTTRLDQVTVTATRSEKQLRDVAASVTVIESKDIEQQMVQDISDMVRYEPGVSVSSDSRGGLQNFNIRGMGGNRVKIMVDNVDQISGFNIDRTYYLQGGRNFVDTETLKAVEIVKGPASSLYGSDAIGGLVAFQTKDPSDLLSATGDDTAGSIKGGYSSANKGFTETLSLANRSGDLESLLIYTRRDNKETASYSGESGIGSQHGKANPSDNSLDNLLTKIQYQLNDTHRIGFTGEYQNSESDIDIKDSNLNITGVTGDDETTRSRLGVFHEWEANLAAFDSAFWQLDWQESETQMDTDVPAYISSRGTAYDNRLQSYSYKESGFQLNTQFDKSLVLGELKHTIVYGFNYIDKEASNKSTEKNLDTGTVTYKDYVPEIAVSSLGLFVQNDIALTEKLTLTPGIRYDKYEYKPSENRATNTQENDSKDSKFTGRLAAVYKLNQDLSLFTQFSQGFKAPDLDDMYYSYNPGRGYEIRANPDLKPEQSNSLEVGLRGSTDLGSYEIITFYNRYKNFIEEVVTTEGMTAVYQQQNISKATIKGIELKGQLWLDEAIDAPVGTTLNASLAYAEGKNTEDNTALNSVAPLQAVLGLNYDAPSDLWGGALIWTLVDEKKTSQIDDPDNNQMATAGYGTMDLTAYYKPADSLTLRAGLFNIADKEYWQWDDVRGVDVTSNNMDRYSQPGRNFTVSAKYDF